MSRYEQVSATLAVHFVSGDSLDNAVVDALSDDQVEMMPFFTALTVMSLKDRRVRHAVKDYISRHFVALAHLLTVEQQLGVSERSLHIRVPNLEKITSLLDDDALAKAIVKNMQLKATVSKDEMETERFLRSMSRRIHTRGKPHEISNEEEEEEESYARYSDDSGSEGETNGYTSDEDCSSDNSDNCHVNIDVSDSESDDDEYDSAPRVNVKSAFVKRTSTLIKRKVEDESRHATRQSKRIKTADSDRERDGETLDTASALKEAQRIRDEEKRRRRAAFAIDPYVYNAPDKRRRSSRGKQTSKTNAKSTKRKAAKQDKKRVSTTRDDAVHADVETPVTAKPDVSNYDDDDDDINDTLYQSDIPKERVTIPGIVEISIKAQEDIANLKRSEDTNRTMVVDPKIVQNSCNAMNDFVTMPSPTQDTSVSAPLCAESHDIESDANSLVTSEQITDLVAVIDESAADISPEQDAKAEAYFARVSARKLVSADQHQENTESVIARMPFMDVYWRPVQMYFVSWLTDALRTGSLSVDKNDSCAVSIDTFYEKYHIFIKKCRMDIDQFTNGSRSDVLFSMLPLASRNLMEAKERGDTDHNVTPVSLEGFISVLANNAYLTTQQGPEAGSGMFRVTNLRLFAKSLLDAASEHRSTVCCKKVAEPVLQPVQTAVEPCPPSVTVPTGSPTEYASQLINVEKARAFVSNVQSKIDWSNIFQEVMAVISKSSPKYLVTKEVKVQFGNPGQTCQSLLPLVCHIDHKSNSPISDQMLQLLYSMKQDYAYDLMALVLIMLHYPVNALASYYWWLVCMLIQQKFDYIAREHVNNSVFDNGLQMQRGIDQMIEYRYFCTKYELAPVYRSYMEKLCKARLVTASYGPIVLMPRDEIFGNFGRVFLGNDMAPPTP